MPKTPSNKKSKGAAASGKPKGACGNHAPFFSPLPPTPQKTKRKRVVSDDEDEEEPITKKKKQPSKSVAHRSADADAADLDRRRTRRSSAGVQNGNPLPRPSPPPEPSSGRDTSSAHNSGQSGRRRAASTHRNSSRRDTAQHVSTPRHTDQRHSAPRDAVQGQSDASSRLSTSNADAPLGRPATSNPGRVFAAALQTLKVLDSQADDLDDLDDLDIEEDDVQTISKGKNGVPEEDEDEEDEEEDEEVDYRLGNNDDDEELSAEAVDELMTVIRSRKEQKYSLTKKQSNPERLPGHFKKWGRHAHRLLGVYTNIFKTITTGMMVLKARPSTPEEYTYAYRAIPNTSPAAAKFYTKKFMDLCNAVPKLKALCGHLLYCTGDTLVFGQFFKKHARAGRSSDISTIKCNFAAYLPRVTVTGGVVIRPLTQVEFTNRARYGGYHSVCTGRLVLPIHKRDAFDQDPIEYNKQKFHDFVRRNKRCKDDRTTEDDKSYPGFLYPSHLDYNELAPHQGIFKNTLCESVVQHLFKGPSFVGLGDGVPNLGRTCLADIYDITKLTPDYLVYAATLIRYLLSVDGRWNGDDKRRSGHRFHTSLHRLLTLDYEMWEEDVESGELFNDEGTEWLSENVFSYYNRLVFGAEEGDPEEQLVECSDYDAKDEDDHDNLRVRALNARRAELEDLRWRRLQCNMKPSQGPQQPRVDYPQPPPLDPAGADEAGAGA